MRIRKFVGETDIVSVDGRFGQGGAAFVPHQGSAARPNGKSKSKGKAQKAKVKGHTSKIPHS
jgi:hypothetical protein